MEEGRLDGPDPREIKDIASRAAPQDGLLSMQKILILWLELPNMFNRWLEGWLNLSPIPLQRKFQRIYKIIIKLLVLI
jgi:hypothetical protein